ncbi:polyprenyl synthetase family protein [bacterium]|nr:polyprenyl synthetase family protein [bacterium]
MIQQNGSLPHRADSEGSPHVLSEGQWARYVFLMNRVQAMLEPAPLAELLREHRSENRFSPINETERIAIDFLVRGGKRFRPFVTLAAYDAVASTGDDPPRDHFSPAIHRAVAAIEAFHKASLVHDDIEDDDLFRYGQQTLHREHGVPVAVNVGDYLVGLGYRWITSSRDEIGASCAADVLHRLMDAHVRLSEGQGAELAWRSGSDRLLSIENARAVYDLKTVPAFEAALYVGIRLASDVRSFDSNLRHFSQELGRGFQILNDLKDWQGDPSNKVVAGQDFRALRPTMLLAIALESASAADRNLLLDRLEQEGPCTDRSGEMESIMSKYRVGAACRAMVDEHRRAALQEANAISHPALRRYLMFLTSKVLEDTPSS